MISTVRPSYIFLRGAVNETILDENVSLDLLKSCFMDELNLFYTHLCLEFIISVAPVNWIISLVLSNQLRVKDTSALLSKRAEMSALTFRFWDSIL